MAAGLILCGTKALLQSATQKNGNMNINTEIFPFSLLSRSLFCALNGCFVHGSLRFGVNAFCIRYSSDSLFQDKYISYVL